MANEPEPAPLSRDICTCFDQHEVSNRRRVRFHAERQDTSSPAWQHLLTLIDEAAADGREVFRPLAELSPQDRREIVTLPPTIAKLTAVKHLNLYGSNLVRLPPEIGAMTSLEEFTPYTSYRLHWYPYELTRCPNLRRSTVSTRALYGNEKLRPPFPALPAAEQDLTELRTCSVCDRSLESAEVHQAWISLRVAADVLPLLVNACSPACLQALPTPPEDYVPTPHTGGPGLAQPPADYA
ncbi:leucine-rich repeat domain-containing protein [Kitasatospora sp. NPDC101183]|uniref:leucine-rich repeat domain-containing protein n=1 Tax=Kitasatospora sp. NPDC101183 TaxID=3364100 RepID=UPI00381F9F2D